ncbi:hypothetical protein BGW80DRAFT_181791 [Lactifluus volemus]|nr:hypothetical protein BGW80DRAFT_181791 [Lactifluus volemus]
MRHRKKVYERMWKDLLHHDSRIAVKQIKYSLSLTMADIALLHGDFALGRSVVPPHAACVRPAQVRWDPRTPLSLENYVVGEMEEVLRAISRVFPMPDEGALYSAMGSLSGVPRRCGASRLLVSRNAAVS